MEKSLTSILLFIGISLLWSFLWFSQGYRLFDAIGTTNSVLILGLGLVPTFGLVFGSWVLRNRWATVEYSLTGGNTTYTLLILAIPVLCLTVIGVDNSYGIQKNVFGLFISLFTLMYALFEEYGWRGYLQPALRTQLNKWLTYTIIGAVWYLWHWFFLRAGNDPKLIMLPLLILASWGIGEIAGITRSILICAALHGIANILLMYGVIANQLNSFQKVIILSTCLIVWIPLISRIKKSTFVTPH